MDIKVEFTDEQAKELMQVALEKQLTPELRDQLVKEALASLLKRHPFNNDLNVLQQAFRRGAERVAEETFREEFDKPEVRAKLRELVIEAYDQLFIDADTRDKTVEKMVSALGSALFGNRY